MTEETKSDSEESPPAPEGEKPKSQKDAELLEAFKRRDTALKRAQAAEARLAEIERETLESRRQKAETEGNLDEQKKLWQQEILRRDEQNKKLKSQIEGYVLKDHIQAKIATKTRYLDDAWGLLKDKFEAREDEEGSYRAVVKTNPYRSVDEELEDFFTARPYLLDNKRKPGGGVPAENVFKSSAGQEVDLGELDRMDKKERVAVLARDKNLRQAYTLHQLKNNSS